MARTKKGSKAPGFDYWSRRPHSGSGYGPEVKKLTNRAERRISFVKLGELLDEFVAELKSKGWEAVDSTTDDRLRRMDLKCSFCQPNKGENQKRRPKHGRAKPKGRDHR